MKNLLLLLFLTFFTISCDSNMDDPYVVVNKDNVILRAKPSDDSNIVARIDSGAQMDYWYHEKGYIRVNSRNSKKSYGKYQKNELVLEGYIIEEDLSWRQPWRDRREYVNPEGNDIMKLEIFADSKVIKKIRELELPGIPQMERYTLLLLIVLTSLLTFIFIQRNLGVFFILLQSFLVAFYVLYEPSLFWFLTVAESYSRTIWLCSWLVFFVCAILQCVSFVALFEKWDDDVDPDFYYLTVKTKSLFYLIGGVLLTLFAKPELEHLLPSLFWWFGVINLVLFLVYIIVNVYSARDKTLLNAILSWVLYTLLGVTSALFIGPVAFYALWLALIVLVVAIIYFAYYVINTLAGGAGSLFSDDRRTVTLKDGTTLTEESDILGNKSYHDGAGTDYTKDKYVKGKFHKNK